MFEKARPPLTRTDLIALVERLLRADFRDEVEREEILEALQQHVVDPGVTDYLFAPDQDMTAEDIIERALAYQPRVANAPR